MLFSISAVSTVSVSAAEINNTVPSYEDVSSDEKYYDAVKMLSKLDIFQGDNLGNFNPDKTITRAEAAAVIVRFLGYEGVISQTETTYVDVPATHWASGYIATGTSLGFITGYGYGYFGPEDTVTYEQVITMLVRALGYEKKVSYENGVYPAAYLSTAAQYGITSNVGGSVGQPAPRKVVAALVYSALSAPIMEQISYGAYAEWAPMDGSSSSRPLKTILSTVFDIHKVKATVKTTELSSTTSTTNTQKDYAKIEIYSVEKGDEEFEEDDVVTIKDNGELKDYLGASLTLYLKESDNISYADYELIDFVTDSRNYDEVVIDDVANIEFGSSATKNFGNENDNAPVLGYYDSKRSKIVTYKIDSDAAVLLNGSYYAGAKDSDMSDSFFEIPYGKITLRDNNDDSKYDMIFVVKYSTYVVADLNTKYQKISDANNSNPTITLDPDDDDLSYTITLDGKKIDFSDLRENDVLTVTANKISKGGKINTSDSTNYSIEVSRETISGTIKEISQDNDNEYNTEYKIGSEYYMAVPEIVNSLALSDEGTFYLDKFGRIAYYEIENSSSSNYAYVVATGKSTSTFDDEINIKVVTASGKVTTLTSGTKGITIYDEKGDSHNVMIDATGSKEDFYDDGWATKLKGKMITYDLNSADELKKIYLPRTNTYRDDKYFSFYKSLTDARFNENSETLGNVLLDSSTKVFFIPDWTLDYDEVTVSSIKALEDDEYYDAYIYHLDKNSVAGLVVINGDNNSVAIKNPVYVVQNVGQTLNSDDERVDSLTVWHEGNKEILISDGNIDLSDLSSGDIISVSLNANNEVSNYAVYVDYDETALFDTTGFELDGEIVEDLEVSYGFVVNKRNTSFALSADPDVTNTEYLYASKANVYKYIDRTRRVEVADWSDVEKYSDNEDMFVFARIYEGSVTDVVIYDGGDPIIERPINPEPTPEPERVKHTVTFIADGVKVAEVEFAEGDTSVVEPTVPSKEGFRGEWGTYTLGTTDIYVSAIYTEIPVETPAQTPETPLE